MLIDTYYHGVEIHGDPAAVFETPDGFEKRIWSAGRWPWDLLKNGKKKGKRALYMRKK
jgi:hypothetical protein